MLPFPFILQLKKLKREPSRDLGFLFLQCLLYILSFSVDFLELFGSVVHSYDVITIFFVKKYMLILIYANHIG